MCELVLYIYCADEVEAVEEVDADAEVEAAKEVEAAEDVETAAAEVDAAAAEFEVDSGLIKRTHIWFSIDIFRYIGHMRSYT